MLPDANLSPPWRPGRRSPAWLLKRPLTWLVGGEIVVMLALFALAWHLLQGRSAPLPPLALLPPVASPSPVASPEPAAAVGTSPKPTPRPALATDLPTWVA